MRGELYCEVSSELKDGYRWRLYARNGRLIACDGEGYTKKTHARRMFQKLFPGVILKDLTDA
jgi:uncharacterized protein YegP (UPF0339 family)